MVLKCRNREEHSTSFSGFWCGIYLWYSWSQRWQRNKFFTFGQVKLLGKMNAIRPLEQTDWSDVKEINYLFLLHFFRFIHLINKQENSRKHTVCDIMFPKRLHTLSFPYNPKEINFSINKTAHVCAKTEQYSCVGQTLYSIPIYKIWGWADNLIVVNL